MAAEVVSEIAEGLDPGGWNEVYVEALSWFCKMGMVRKLSGERRLRFIYAVAQCLVRSSSPTKALKWTRQLRSESRKSSDHWATAQSFLLDGAVHERAGQPRSAVAALLRAVRLAKRHHLGRIAGHALHNLAVLYAASDPDKAAKFLQESLRIKRQSEEPNQQVGAMIGRGLVAAGRGQPGTA
jgi:hypothetical protein